MKGPQESNLTITLIGLGVNSWGTSEQHPVLSSLFYPHLSSSSAPQDGLQHPIQQPLRGRAHVTSLPAQESGGPAPGTLPLGDRPRHTLASWRETKGNVGRTSFHARHTNVGLRPVGRVETKRQPCWFVMMTLPGPNRSQQLETVIQSRVTAACFRLPGRTLFGASPTVLLNDPPSGDLVHVQVTNKGV